MKTISQIISLFLSDMKPWQIHMVLVFITLTFEAGWFMFVASLDHAMKTFACLHDATGNQVTGSLSLCH